MEFDISQRFIFEETDIRGELVRCTDSFEKILATKTYPEVAQKLLGEFLVASVLLSTTMKFEGRLSLQATSKGEIPFITMECDSNREVRGIAQVRDSFIEGDFNVLLAQGTLAITITPAQGNPYQGIVSLQGNNLAECLAEYFLQSEQLATSFVFAVGTDKGRATAAGMILQQMPKHRVASEDRRTENWSHLTQLGHTLRDDELLSVEYEELLHRLFHQDPLRVFSPKIIQYRCTCSRERTFEALETIPRTELDDIIKEDGALRLDCQFCCTEYSFTREDIDRLPQ